MQRDRRNLLDFARSAPWTSGRRRSRRPRGVAPPDRSPDGTPGLTLDADLNGHPIVGRADFGQLRQAFVNILLNAIEAQARRHPDAAVDLGALGQVVVSVTDTGSASTRSTRPHLRSVLHDEGEGHGLGLPWSTGSSKAWRDVRVDSRKGQGTTVRIRLPSAPVPRPDASGEARDCWIGEREAQAGLLERCGRTSDRSSACRLSPDSKPERPRRPSTRGAASTRRAAFSSGSRWPRRSRRKFSA